MRSVSVPSGREVIINGRTVRTRVWVIVGWHNVRSRVAVVIETRVLIGARVPVMIGTCVRPVAAVVMARNDVNTEVVARQADLR